MTANLPGQKDATIGYFTVVHDEQTGWTGGLLVLDRAGRPLEFQCTLPVRPTRAHEILFGPTLPAHVIGDVIGKALVEKCRTPITLLCGDQQESRALEAFTKAPIAIVQQAREEADSESLPPGTEQVELAGATLQVSMERSSDVEQMAAHYSGLPDAMEPFERIREAIQEAHSQLARQRHEAA